jgi:hypothetical protein
MEQAAPITVAKHRSQEKQAMRALILAAAVFAVLAVLANANTAQAGLSTAPREAVASADTATPAESNRPEHARTERRAHHPRRIGGPIGAIGGAIGGLFGR